VPVPDFLQQFFKATERVNLGGIVGIPKVCVGSAALLTQELVEVERLTEAA